MNKTSSAKTIALCGVLSALTFVFLLVETFGFTAWLGSFTPAILTLPLAVAISLTGDKRHCIVGGAIFGCCSFFLAVIIANPIFINPLISILPRLFIGVIAFFVYLLLSKLTKNAKSKFIKEILPISVASAFGILTNSVFTIFMMWVFNASAIATIMTVIISFNFLAEVIGAIVLCPIYVKVIKKVNKAI